MFKATEGCSTLRRATVRDTPIAEQAIVGTAARRSLRGLRPVAELMFADFAGVCYDQLANQLAKYRYMTGGQVTVPVDRPSRERRRAPALGPSTPRPSRTGSSTFRD